MSLKDKTLKDKSPLNIQTAQSIISYTDLNAPPTSWLVLPQDRGSQAIVAIDNEIFLIDTGQCLQQVG
jgi:hypothetical protein